MDYKARIRIKSFLLSRIMNLKSFANWVMVQIEVFTTESGEEPMNNETAPGPSPSVEPLAFVFPPLKVEEHTLTDVVGFLELLFDCCAFMSHITVSGVIVQIYFLFALRYVGEMIVGPTTALFMDQS
ncbi:hypothetical protein Tco_0251112 [Tanacetum coccineum]